MTLTYVPTDRTSSFHTYGFSNEELTSTNPPIVYRQPQSRTVSGGTTVILDGLAGGEAPVFAQWQKNGVDLLDQTNLVLTLADVNGNDTGDYTLVLSNALGVVTSMVAKVEVGLALANPSFEADSFTNYPGYIAANFPITGWEASLPIQTGINPVSDGSSPFANTGTIPDGSQVAFIQADGGTLSQVITNMTVGTTYYVKFYENARSTKPAPALEVTFGGDTVVPKHVVNPGEYVSVVSGPILATSDSAELVFLKTAGPAAGDSTVVIDNVAVLELPPTPPNFLTQPPDTYIKQGDTLALTPVVLGTLPISYQWQREEADAEGATSSTLEIPDIQMNQAGNYRLIVTNIYGAATSEVAVVRVGLGIPELFNTGVDSTGALLPGGTVDPHYQLISSADPSWPGPELVVYYDAWPVTNGTYMSNGPLSSWISPRTNDPAALDQHAADLVNGLYIYRTAFVLDTLDPDTAEIQGKWTMDDSGVDIRLNGVSLDLTNNAGYRSFGAFVITSGFVAGSNTLDFVITNGTLGPCAFRAELYGVAMPLPPSPPEIVSEPQSILVQETEDASFTVLATGSPPLTYQWYYEGIDLPETNRTLTLTRVSQFDQQGSYWVVITNPEGTTNSEAVVLTINAAPVPATDWFGALLNTPFAFDAAKLLLNDSDPDGDAISVASVSGTSTNGGTVTLESGTVTYTPVADYSGADEFTYIVQDDRGGSAVGTVEMVVGSASDLLHIVSAPVLTPEGNFQASFAGVPNYTYTIQVATDINGPWEVLTTVTADANGMFDVVEPVSTPAPPTRFYRADTRNPTAATTQDNRVVAAVIITTVPTCCRHPAGSLKRFVRVSGHRANNRTPHWRSFLPARRRQHAT